VKRRAAICLGIALLAAPGSLLLAPTWPRNLVAWVQGEHFYRGQPTSYWSRQVRDWLLANDWGCTGPFPAIPEPSWFDRVWAYFGVRPGQADGPDAPLLWQGDPEAVPILVDLLKDEDEAVRLQAALSLAELGPLAHQAVPELLRRQDDESPGFRWAVRHALEKIGKGR
jgi:hypothetical protein